MATVVGEDKTVVSRCTCKSCAAIVEYSRIEVQEVRRKDYAGGSDGIQYIYCPRCHSKIVLKSW